MLGYIIAFFVAMLVIGKVYKYITGTLPEWKYFKPYSLTWWSVVTPGAVGILISGEPLHGWELLAAQAAETVENIAPGTTPEAMIGFTTLGLGVTGRMTGDRK